MESEKKVWDWGQNTKEPLNVVFIEGKSGRRNPINHEAHGRTGWNTRTGIGSVGVGITHCRNGLVEIECDVYRLGVDLKPEIVAPLEAKWKEQAEKLPSAARYQDGTRLDYRVFHFPTLPEFLEDWKVRLREVLSNPQSYENLIVPECTFS